MARGKKKRMLGVSGIDPTSPLDVTFKGTEPVRVGDFGNRLKMSGILYCGEGASVILLSPTTPDVVLFGAKVYFPTLAEWTAIIRQTDDPVFFEKDESGTLKAVHHKMARAISGAVQQRIWARDDFRCLYCGKGPREGEQITVDHFVPLELGGENDPANLITCCRRENKAKGAIHPKKFCEDRGLDYRGLVEYLARRASLAFIGHLM